MNIRFLKAKTMLGITIVVLMILVGVSVLGKKNSENPGTRVIPILTPVISPTTVNPNQKPRSQLPDYPFEYKGLVLELNNIGTALRVEYTGSRPDAEAKVEQLLTEYGIDKTKLEIIFIGLGRDSDEPPPGFGQAQ